MAITYHLWIKPSGKVYDILRKTIGNLSKAYQGPFFDPHVTLLSFLTGTEEEIAFRSEQLGTSLQPFDVQLNNPAYGDQYFQCVFLKAQESPELMNAHKLARKLFLKDTNAYMPHLSLLYGHYSVEQKDKITATLSDTLRLSFSVEKFELIRSGSEDPKDWISILTVSLSR